MQYSIVDLSEVKENSDFRIDAEYWKPEFSNINKLINKYKFEKLLNNNRIITDGSHEVREYKDSGVLFLRVQDIFENNIEIKERIFISEEENKKLNRSEPEYNKDILITKTGKIGVATVFTLHERANIPADIAILKNNSHLNSFFISTFINSKYGKLQFIRNQSGLGRPRLVLNSFDNLIIPLLSQPFQESIASLVNTSYALRQSADTLYKEAEEILLEELGLKNYQPQNKKCFVKMLSDTQEAGRIDAEYFQPKYEDVIDKIKKYKNGFLFFEDKDINDKNFNSKKDIKYKYIELANISGNSSIDGVENIIGCDLPTRARRIVKANDLIVSSIEGSLNSIALISKKLDGALCSTGFFVVNSNKINSEALLVFLKSNLGQMQLKRGCKGTILTAISKDELKNIIVPLLPQSIQSQISAKIQQSFESREKSKQLLEVAKRAVEIVIEENEEAGLKYIEENK